MCVCVNPRSRSPEPDPRESGEGEGEGDVELLVGEPAWRFSARRSALAAASPVFEALFYGPMATRERTLRIPDVDPRAFDVLLRFISGGALDIRSVGTALSTLYAAHKYLLPGLVRACSEYLHAALQPDTVLDVFVHARHYSPAGPSPRGSPERLPSAPLETDDPPEPPGVAGWSAVLLTRCLDYMDAHCEVVLVQEALEDLPRDALRDFLARDTLRCGELAVLNALERWADRETRRQCLPPTPANRRAVLGGLIFLVRYPLLSAEEFIRGPVQSDLLSPEETKFFSSLIAGASPASVPLSVKSHLPRMLTRRSPPAPAPTPADVCGTEPKRRSKGWRRSKNSKSLDKTKPEKERRCSASCFADSFVDVLVCIFD